MNVEERLDNIEHAVDGIRTRLKVFPQHEYLVELYTENILTETKTLRALTQARRRAGQTKKKKRENPGPSHRYCPVCREPSFARTVRMVGSSTNAVAWATCPHCGVETEASKWLLYHEMGE